MNLNPEKRKPLSRLALDGLTALADALEDLLTVLVKLELGDDDVRGGERKRNALAVALLANNTLNVDGPLQTVDAGDLALPALLGAPDHSNLVVAADRDGADLSREKKLC